MKPFITLLLTISFTATSLLAQTTKTQTIKGRVIDQATGQPLVGATVLIKDSNPAIGTFTGENGEYRLPKVLVGKYSLLCSYSGYQKEIEYDLVVTSSKELTVNFEMNSMVIQVDIYPDKTKPNNSFSKVSTIPLDAEKIEVMPGAANDLGRYAQSVPGVQPSQDNNSDIIIRGNSPVGLIWRLEGVEILNPNHFARKGSSGGGITMLSAQLLGKADFSTGAFAAEYGNGFSGVFDMNLRKGNNEKREHRFKFGLLGTDLAAEGPFKKGGGSYLINYRYSTLGILNDLGFRLVGKRIDNNFQDLSFNLSFPGKDSVTRRKFTVFGVGGLSEELWDAVEDSLVWSTNYRTQRTFTTDMGVIGATYEQLLGEKARIKAVVALSHQRVGDIDDLVDTTGISLQSDGITNNPFTITNTSTYEVEDYRSTRLSSHVFYQRAIKKGITLKTGLIGSHLRFNFVQEQFSELTNSFETILSGDDNSNLLQGYAQLGVELEQGWTFNLGLLSMYFMLNNTSSLEPRFAASYQFDEKSSITLAYGLHSRIVPIGSYFTNVIDDNGLLTQPNLNLDLIKSHHTVLGYKYNTEKNFTLNLELYHQHLFNIPVSQDPSMYWILNERDGYATQALVSEGTGQNVGVDLSLSKTFKTGLLLMLSSSLFDSRYTASDGEIYNTRYNSRYSVSGLIGYEKAFKNGNSLEFGMRNINTGGLRYTPGNKALSEAAGEYVEEEGKAFTERVGTYFRIDGRIGYRINKVKKISEVKERRIAYRFAINVQNVLNRINKRDVIWDEGLNDFEFRDQSGLIPVFSFQIDF